MLEDATRPANPGTAGTRAGQLERRRALDEALDVESKRALLRVFELGALDRKPANLVPLACALADAAAAAGSPVGWQRLEAVTRNSDGDHQVTELAARLRVPIRPVTLTGRWWRERGQPLVVTRQTGPAALIPGYRGYTIREPGGTTGPLTEEAAAAIDERAWAVYPRLPDGAVSGRDLIPLALHRRFGMVAALAGLAALITVLGVVLPYATGHIVGVIVPAGASGTLLGMLIALAEFTVALLAATLAQSFIVLAVGSFAAARLTAAIWDRLLHLPPSFFRGRSSGEIAQQLTAVDQMRTLVSSSVVAALGGSAMSVAAIGLLLVFAPRIGAVVVVVFALAITVALAVVRRQARSLQTVVDDRNRLNGLLLGILSGVSKLRAAGAERRAHALWRRGYAFQQEAQRDAALQGVRLAVLQGLLPGLFLLAVVASVSVIEPDVSLADFTTAAAAAGQLAAATSAMIVVAATLAQLRPLYRSVLPIIQTPAEVGGGAQLPDRFAGDVRLDGVTFAYSEEVTILDRVSFEAEAGTFVAVVGPSGAGKSTLLRIILGFEQPREGEVLIDGKPLGSLDLEAVRRRMGTVIQGAKIMTGTILTNIVGALPLGQDAAWEAAEMAGIADAIRAMPMQMSTFVAEGGAGFSGGELQRLLLARALVRKPKILLLDEATSALDNDTQRRVMDRLGALGVTRIVIAHRLSTVARADRIVVLDHGRVVESGHYDQLVADDGLFASLARRQML